MGATATAAGATAATVWSDAEAKGPAVHVEANALPVEVRAEARDARVVVAVSGAAVLGASPPEDALAGCLAAVLRGLL